ncbi:AAA family ATPase [Paenibacillus ginsengihumi]|uniref:AAA family ATPase n=1 Tax=Paenibacillus ginsengihumi TaxID=431596 RepID=UPI00039FF0F6|nr:AAA family ATPase [Paenibacillus ginsengihumi]
MKRKTLAKVLKFLFPEVQLIQLVREQGFFTREEKAARPQTYTYDEQSYSYGNKGAGPYMEVTRKTSPTSTYTYTYYEEVLDDPQKMSSFMRDFANMRDFMNMPGFANLQGFTDRMSKDSPIRDLDHLFGEIEMRVNRKVLGQQPFVKDLVASFKQGFMEGRKDKARNVILLAGAAGTGKKTALQCLLDEMSRLHLLHMPKLTEIDLSRYSEEEVRSNFIKDMHDAFQGWEGAVVFSGMEKAESTIVGLVGQLAAEGSFRTSEGVSISADDFFLVFYIDEPAERESEYGRIPASLTKRIPMPILKGIRAAAISSALDKETMEQVVENLLAGEMEKLSANMQTPITVRASVYEALARIATANKTFGEAVEQWVEQELTPHLMNLRARNEIQRGERVVIKHEVDTFYAETRRIEVPIKALSFSRKESIEDVLRELDALTGLEPVKKFVRELLETVRVNRMRSQEGGQSVAMALHMVFTGNPGTGKTTVARLIARILHALGLLSQGQLVEVARQDLVGQYIGSTAPKTMAKVNEALGGVLFIDEAYTLARQDHDTFGLEAIDTIVKAMEDHRDNLVVVLAGYTQEMEVFLRANPGLRSRFPFIVEFPDYTPQDMLNIMMQMASKNGFRIEEEAHEGLTELFGQRQIPGRNDSGNGRLVRNLFEEAIRKQSIRIAQAGETKPDLQLLVKADFGVGEKEAFNLENELAAIVGLDQVKTFLRTLEKQLIVDRRRKEAGIQVNTVQTLNMIFTGNPGTGKTTMARLLAGMLRSMGYLKKGQLIEVDRSDLVGEYMGHTATKTKQVVESALGGVLFIDEAYALAQDGGQGGGYGKEAIDTLVRLIELHKDNLVVILAGYTDDMQRFVQLNPGMSSRFPLQIEFPDYTAEEMQQIATVMVKARGFTLAPDVPPQLVAYFNDKQIPGKKDGGNGRLVRNVLEEAIRRQAERLADQPYAPVDKLNELTAADFGLASPDAGFGSVYSRDWAQAPTRGRALDELDTIIGLTSVKEFVRSISTQIEVAKQREEQGLPRASAQTLHMIFKGNPGTGKTTIARILARRFKELGVVKTDTLIETDRSGLVAGYVGQTALKTREVIERALGGILFVDEAYALAEGDQFGQEAIDTLVKAMDDYRDRLIVILAGYDEDMERFLDRNAGLRSRFPNIITFPDYTESELLQIAKLQLGQQGYKLGLGAEGKLLSIFGRYRGDKTAGNGRLVRNLVEKAIRNHAVRISGKSFPTTDDLSNLLPEDFEG